MKCEGYKIQLQYTWRTYLCERNCDGRDWGAGLIPRNSHESVIVSMTFKAQPVRSVYGDLLYVSIINI